MLWPDLESYEWEAFTRDLNALRGMSEDERPLFIVAMDRVTQKEPMLEKMQAIQEFLGKEKYVCTYSDEMFAIYQ